MKRTELDNLLAKIAVLKDVEKDLKTIIKEMTADQKKSLEKNGKIKAVMDKHKGNN